MENNEKSLVYLAVPYTHKDPKVVEERFHKVNKVAGKLMSEGLIIFSPISHTHPIAVAGSLPTDWAFWKNFDTAYLQASKKLIILKLEGWEKSTGVTAEINLAKELGIPIEYINE